MWILVVIVVLQAIVIAYFARSKGAAVVVLRGQNNSPPIHIQENPLRAAIEYESSDRKFEELVKLHPAFVTLWDGDLHPHSLIEEAAIQRRTNFVRILVKNGANVRDAIVKLEGKEASIFKDAVGVLKVVEAELSLGDTARGTTNQIAR